jgi:hypothetical protein
MLGFCVTAHADIIWLGENRPDASRFELVSRARTGLVPDEDIEMAFACRDRSCPLVGGIYLPEFLQPLDPGGFEGTATAEHVTTVESLGTFRTLNESFQRTRLQPNAMTTAGWIRVSYDGPTGRQQSSRAIGQSSARIHFRVVGADHHYLMSANFIVSETNKFITGGYLGLRPISNVGGGGTRDYWEYAQDLTRPVTSLQEHGILKPGLYALAWSISSDITATQYSNAYDMQMLFRPCQGSTTPEINGPYADMDSAAQAASQRAWQRTLGTTDTEFGGLIYRVNSTDYRYVTPIRGKVGSDGVAHVDGGDMLAAYADVLRALECAGTRVEGLAAIYHTHPTDTNPAYLSLGDINAAVIENLAVYMRGANGLLCGIHKYEPTRGDTATRAVETEERNGAASSPAAGTEDPWDTLLSWSAKQWQETASWRALQQERWDGRRFRGAKWIGLDAGHAPARCNLDGKTGIPVR